MSKGDQMMQQKDARKKKIKEACISVYRFVKIIAVLRLKKCIILGIVSHVWNSMAKNHVSLKWKACLIINTKNSNLELI